jgi:hypothetical protein
MWKEEKGMRGEVEVGREVGVGEGVSKRLVMSEVRIARQWW